MITFTDAPSKLAGNLAAMQKRVQDLAPALKPCAEKVKQLLDDAFYFSRSPDGQKWAANDPDTIRQKRGGDKPGIGLTGNLRGSQYASVFGTNSIVFGTNIPYGVFMQFGTKFAPRRAFLPFNENGTLMTSGPAGVLWAQITDIVRGYVFEGVVRP